MNTPIGFIVSWHTPATVKLADLRAGLTAAGLAADELAPDLQPRSLVSRSAAMIAKNLSNKDVKRLARPVAPKARQITREVQTSDTSLDYSKEASIFYNDEAKRLASKEIANDTLDEAAKTVDETRTATDVTRILQRVVEAAGTDLIPVREQGGAYFLPDGSKVIAQMATVLEAIGGTLSRFACTIGHGSDASVANVITDYMLKQIAELKTAIDELNEKGIRADVKTRRIARVAELRERIAAYTTLVGTQAATLTSALNTAEATLLAKLAATDDDAPADLFPSVGASHAA